jgi:hypothetical protein
MRITKTICPTHFFDSIRLLFLGSIYSIKALFSSGAFDSLRYFIQCSFICNPSDSNMSPDAGIEPGTVERLQWESNASSTRPDLIHTVTAALCPNTTLITVCLIRFWGRYKLNNNDYERRRRKLILIDENE